jgi:F-type H+-transporting ATPase subunit b
MGYLIQTDTFWAFIGLILFFILMIVLGVPKMIARALDGRADKIRTELEEARRLREEAQEMLASYERRQREAAREAEDIVKKAKADAEHLREAARKDIAERIERRTALAEQRIAQAETQAAKEVRALAADLAVEAAGTLLKEGMTKAQRAALIKASISEAGERLN